MFRPFDRRPGFRPFGITDKRQAICQLTTMIFIMVEIGLRIKHLPLRLKGVG